MIRLAILIAWWLAFGAAMYAQDAPIPFPVTPDEEESQIERKLVHPDGTIETIYKVNKGPLKGQRVGIREESEEAYQKRKAAEKKKAVPPATRKAEPQLPLFIDNRGSARMFPPGDTPETEYKQFGGYWYKSTGGDWFLCAECNPQLGGGQTIGLPGPSPMSPPPLYYVPNYSAIPNSSRGFGAGFSFGIGGG